MDFNDTPEEAELRAEMRAWLSENAPLRGSKEEAALVAPATVAEDLQQSKDWQAKKADARYAFIQWPEEYGGRDSQLGAVVFGQEEGKFAVARDYFINTAFVGPTVMSYGTDEQKKRYLPPMLRGEEVWCQLFSEPVAGSDLAGIKTRAERDGDDWIINGQKVWTSFAHIADLGILVTRHDPTVVKHQGMTYFLLDMKTPGIEVSPIKQISGGSEFCEVFLTDVRIPDSCRLGGVGDGWSVALTTLMNERFATGGIARTDYEELLKLAQDTELESGPAIENAAVREKLADWYVQTQGIRMIQNRTLTDLSHGRAPGPEASIAKLVNACKTQDLGSFGMDIQDMGGVMMDPDGSQLRTYFNAGFLGGPGSRIAGGTDEIMRNILAERVLGMPKDIRVDRDVAFNQLPSSG